MTMLQLMMRLMLMMTMRDLAGPNIVHSSNPELILDSFLKAGDFLLIVVVYIKMSMVKKLTTPLPPYYVNIWTSANNRCSYLVMDIWVGYKDISQLVLILDSAVAHPEH